jgi:epoxide hydrolase-like predicted phosphatase
MINKTKLIIFDIGGVLRAPEQSFELLLDDLANAVGTPPEKVREFYAHYLDRMLIGKISAAQFFLAMKKKFHLKKDPKKIWLEIALKKLQPNKKLLDIVDKLRSQYQVAIVSNTSEMKNMVDEQLDFFVHFDRLFFSYKLKMKKPSKRIFLYVLSKTKLKPNEVMFVDDREANLKVARELGIKSIQFNNNKQLITEFTRLGLL